MSADRNPREPASVDDSPPSPRAARRRRPCLRRLLVTAAAGMLLVPLAMVGSVVWLRSAARGHVFDLESVPVAPVALVLGAKVHSDGTPSAFLTARLELAKRLYDAGKVRVLLVSGDHARWEYDEPGAMRRWLVEHGVPAEKVVVDHAGFDTYDSCLRAHRIFGVNHAIVVTQSFHIARAVTLCRNIGIDAVGVGDDSVSRFERSWARGAMREYGAGVKAVYDMVTRRDPVFLGRREPGVDDALRF